MTTPHINQLRQHLLDTLADLRNPHRPMEPDRARAVAQVAGVLVDSARVEVDYLKATGQDVSNFIDGLKAPEVQALPHTVHRGSWPKVVE
jgi:BioD-like phosphotransacetylase family protein